jgi:hypothetical protein
MPLASNCGRSASLIIALAHISGNPAFDATR